MIRTIFLSVLLSLVLGTALQAQQLPPPEPLMPEEYDPSEFPLWAHDLRRFEVIAVGTYPITFLASSLVYDFSVYAANGFNPAYSMGSQRDGNDIAIIAGSAAGVSLLIAVVDLFINISRRDEPERKKNEQ